MCDLNRLLSDPPLQQETGIITLHMFYEGGVCVCVRVCEGEEKSRLSEVIHYRRAVISPNANRTYWPDFQFIFFINLLLFPGLNQRVELTFNRVWSGALKEFHTCLSVGGGNHHWVERAPRLPLRHRMWKNLEVIEIDDRKSTFCPMDMKEKGEFFFIWQKKRIHINHMLNGMYLGNILALY